MARLQILELPEGTSDERAPFVLVVDQCEPQRIILGADGPNLRTKGDYWGEVAGGIGARGVIVTPDTVDIPANDLSAEFREGLHESVAELYESARTSLSESETLGHRLLQRAEIAEAVTAQTKGLMERRTRTLRERAERAEERLAALGKQDTERMDQVTDALGFDRLRDWGEIVSAIKLQRRMEAEGGHLFGEPGYLDPDRCAQCGLSRGTWVFGTDPRTCSEVRAAKGGS